MKVKIRPKPIRKRIKKMSAEAREMGKNQNKGYKEIVRKLKVKELKAKGAKKSKINFTKSQY